MKNKVQITEKITEPIASVNGIEELLKIEQEITILKDKLKEQEKLKAKVMVGIGNEMAKLNAYKVENDLISITKVASVSTEKFDGDTFLKDNKPVLERMFDLSEYMKINKRKEYFRITLKEQVDK